MRPSIKSQSAFTLIEILAVLLIIVFVFSLAGRKLLSKDRKIRSAFQELILLNRRIAAAAKTRGSAYRLAVRVNLEGPEEYWVEKLAVYADDSEGETEAFALDERFFPSPQKIHPLLEIIGMESVFREGEEGEEEENESEAVYYIYYAPKGLGQETAIQFFRPDNKARWTLYLHPVQKEFHLLEKERTLEEIKEL